MVTEKIMRSKDWELLLQSEIEDTITAEANYELLFYWLKVRGFTSRELEELDIFDIKYRTIQKHINKGKSIFKGLFSIIRLIELELRREDKLEKEIPNILKFKLLTLSDFELKRYFKKKRISEQKQKEILEMRKDWGKKGDKIQGKL